MDNYHKICNPKKTPQTKPIPGRKDMAANSAGGYGFKVSIWTQLERFLILGSTSGTYYASSSDLTETNTTGVLDCLTEDGMRAVDIIVNTSVKGRAPKNDPALYALALATMVDSAEVRKYAFSKLNDVARIGTHLFTFVEYRTTLMGWSRGMRTAVANWYLSKEPDQLAYQVLKYQQRDGWSHKDVLSLIHIDLKKVKNVETRCVLKSVVAKHKIPSLDAPCLLDGFIDYHMGEVNVSETKRYIDVFGLTREMLKTEHLTRAPVWMALLERGLPATAMVRNLGNMTKIGLLAPFTTATGLVVSKLLDAKWMNRSRVHPIQVLAALMTYQSGGGVRGQGSWTPVDRIVGALNVAFINAFESITPTGKRMLLGLDVSGSMGHGYVSGVPGLTPAFAAAAMALVTAKTEAQYQIMGFSAIFQSLGITASSDLQSAYMAMTNRAFGPTDCALPMTWALENGVEADAFVIYTDSETWCGDMHPTQALDMYQQKTGIGAKLITVAMVSNHITIADPTNPYMLDVVGFDTSTPAAISGFIEQDIK